MKSCERLSKLSSLSADMATPICVVFSLSERTTKYLLVGNEMSKHDYREKGVWRYIGSSLGQNSVIWINQNHLLHRNNAFVVVILIVIIIRDSCWYNGYCICEYDNCVLWWSIENNYTAYAKFYFYIKQVLLLKKWLRKRLNVCKV